MSLVKRALISICSRYPSKLIARSFYDWKSRCDTIFAPATTVDTKRGSPLAIIRVSGSKTSQVIGNLTNLRINDESNLQHSYEGRKLVKPRHATLVNLLDPDTRDLIDVGLVIWFPKPNSYTGEDTCELHVHGSRSVVSKILDVLGKLQGLRPAGPGEFTRRAVHNKKLTLVQAESIHELISANTDRQRKLALQGLTNPTKHKYNAWIDELTKILAHLEASIDFGEDELIGEHRVVSECIFKLKLLARDMKHFIETSTRCRDLIQFGARVAILGRPNTGKSTLMNLLCRQNKSIVSDLSGTTRDVIEHSLELDGHSVILSDTAGLKQLTRLQDHSDSELGNDDTAKLIEKHDLVEREGIRRAVLAAKKSTLIIYLIDGAQLKNEDEFELTKRELIEILELLLQGSVQEKSGEETETQIKSVHLVVNKIDICQNDIDCLQRQQDKLESLVSSLPQMSDKLVDIYQVSCKTGKNFDSVTKNISSSLSCLLSPESTMSNRLIVNDNANCAYTESELNNVDIDYVNERHLALLRSTSRHLEQASRLDFSTIDEMAQHVREAVDYMSRIIGHVTNEQVIDMIFRDFCIGK